MSRSALCFLWRAFANALLVLLFLAAFSYALLVSYGYRFDPLQIKVLESGIIDLNSVTPEADIYLDGQLLENLQTPTHTPNLNLRTYHLTLTKAGFYPWDKNVKVQEDVVTHVGEIKLIPEITPTRQTSYGSSDLFSASDNQVATYTSSNNLIKLFTPAGELISKSTSPATPSKLFYLNNRLYLQDENQTFWQLLSNETWQIVNTAPLLPETDIFSPDQKQNLFLSGQYEIWNKNLSTQTSSLLFRFGNPVTYLAWFSNNQILFEQNNQVTICDKDGSNCVILSSTDTTSTLFLPASSLLFYTLDQTLYSLDLSSASNNLFGKLFR